MLAGIESLDGSPPSLGSEKYVGNQLCSTQGRSLDAATYTTKYLLCYGRQQHFGSSHYTGTLPGTTRHASGPSQPIKSLGIQCIKRQRNKRFESINVNRSKYYIIYVTDISRLPVANADAIHASCILKAHHFFGTISRSSKPRMVSSRRRA
jgi:hypothetical protein